MCREVFNKTPQIKFYEKPFEIPRVAMTTDGLTG
jgi:hypothetical protein